MPAPQPQPAVTPGVPFDRTFFQHVLPQSIPAFCQQVGCDMPVVELLTVDGTTHYVVGISGVSDTWVALHTAQPDHAHPVQTFIPYQTIFRVEIHAADDEKRRHLGFLAQPPEAGSTSEQVSPEARLKARAIARKG
jgi:hypothetical protein